MRWSVYLAAAVAVLIVGGTLAFSLTRESDEDQIRSTVERFYEAAGTGDGVTACELMTEDARLFPVDICARGIETDFESSEAGITGNRAGAMRRTKVENISIRGKKAYVSLSPRGEVELEKVDGDWRISYNPL